MPSKISKNNIYLGLIIFLIISNIFSIFWFIDAKNDLEINKYKYIYTNSNIVIKIIKFIIDNSNKKIKKSCCDKCNKKFDYIFIYKHKNFSVKITELDLHFLQFHNMINTNLYKKISTHKFEGLYIDWVMLATNQLNVLDGLYEVGSNQIYTENNKNISQSKIMRFSEHAGFIYFEKNKVSNINVITGSRVEPSDPTIFMPKNCLEALKVNYIFHTHPKTPYLGSRIKNGIIYEFPSISDIIHFIDHHNNGKLLGSIVVAPEGLYIIRKNNFNRENISVDYDVMINDLEEIFLECYNDSYVEYSSTNYENLKINDEIKLPENLFYFEISTNYNYINKINKILMKYDIFIDYYARTYFEKTKFITSKWIFDDIYLPTI